MKFTLLAGYTSRQLLCIGMALFAPCVATAGNIYQPVAPMGTARYGHTITALADGRALVVGGTESQEASTSEIYDPVTGAMTPVGSPLGFLIRQVVALADHSVLAIGSSQVSRFDPTSGTWISKAPLSHPYVDSTATLLADGKVLLSGGDVSNQLYDPQTDNWTAAGSLLSPRTGHSATLLKSGKILIAGGVDLQSNELLTAEIHDPTTGLSTAAGSLPGGMSSFTATLLPSGKVLVLGHSSISHQDESLDNFSAIYDPESGQWSNAPNPSHARTQHTATLLADGTVLVGGGIGEILSEIYDPQQNAWTFSDDYTTSRYDQAACLLNNGQVLVTGGRRSASSEILNSSEIFTPSPRDWVSAAELNVPRQGHSTTVLQDGKVLITGGMAAVPGDVHPGATATAEIYNPVTNTCKLVAPMHSARAYHPAVLLPDGNVLVIGSGAEIYHPATDKWTATVKPPTDLSYTHALLLTNGTVIAAGGVKSAVNTGNAYLYQPHTNTWSALPPMKTARRYHSMTLLADGRVFVHGGDETIGYSFQLRSCEIFNPATGTWSQPDQSLQTRSGHSATLLPNGKVFVCGGLGLLTREGHAGTFPLDSAELFDPATGTWTNAETMPRTHTNHVSALLSDGRVLIAGGQSPADWENLTEGTSSTEIYDPKQNTWESTAAFVTPRTNTSGVLLQNGKVFVAGGFGPNDFGHHTHFVSDMEIYDPILPEISVQQPIGTDIPAFSAKSLGNVALGEASNLKFTIRNQGSASLRNLHLSIKGSAAADFKITGGLSATNLAPNGTATFTLRFTPTSNGLKSAILSISSNDGDEKPFTINLSGNAVSKPEIAIFQPINKNLVDGKTTKNFGSVIVGKKSTAKVFTIKNKGTAKLTKLSIKIDGSPKKDFIVSPLKKAALAPGEATTIKVIFQPAATGLRRATILIRSNDADESPFDIKITGTGIKK